MTLIKKLTTQIRKRMMLKMIMRINKMKKNLISLIRIQKIHSNQVPRTQQKRKKKRIKLIKN